MAISIFNTIGSNICLVKLQGNFSGKILLKNIGVACSHMILSIKSICFGLNKLDFNNIKIRSDLESNKIVVMKLILLKLKKLNICGNKDVNQLCNSYIKNKKDFELFDFLNFLEINNIIVDHKIIEEFNIDFKELLSPKIKIIID